MRNRLRGETSKPAGGRGASSAHAPINAKLVRRHTSASSVECDPFRFLAITPFEYADVPLARRLWRQDVAAAIDIGRDAAAWPALLASIASERAAGVGVRIPDGVTIVRTLRLPESVRFLVVAGDGRNLPRAWRRVPVLAQICSLDEAERALEAGVAGLIAKGQESGGKVGDESSFVLLQRLLAAQPQWMAAGHSPVPIWCQGGIALHTAAGAFAGGAFGVVFDSILAAFPECGLPAAIKAKARAMDGSEVRQIAGYQVHVWSLQDLPALDGMDGAAVRAALMPKNRSDPPALLPVGQDTALAGPVHAECANIESLVHTLRLRAAAQIRQAQTLRVLDEGNAWADSHKVRYPIAQGPMTRVSDTAAFAAAVADAGALPFLALALMPEKDARPLLEATRSQVGNRPWGAGVLGFAPPEILQPQLQLIRQFKPSALLIAGGRPSQARPFVEMGVPTYLHVPSPGLLDEFLKDGATHFVFEGRECGGHVGPRYSFVLWEQMLAVLAKTETVENLHILFAGGIHDERSAAMVAAIAAPLAARGAKIGVLMGTAYIATREAVSCGSIIRSFQDKALSGECTALVETAPGHAIRCLPSGFVDLFEREKNRLRREGVSTKAAWSALEALTVGRLRVASKGVDYVDGVLTPVGAERQDAEGMYMIGQAIAMKRAVITVAELHAQVTRGATRHLAEIHPPAVPRASNAEPVAIVGMACIFPGSPDLEAYWANIVEGRDPVREVPAERWNAAQYYAAGAAVSGKTVSKWGGFVDDTPFDPLKYGIPPQSLAAIEPVQLLSLEVASRALQDAGYGERNFDRQKTAVIFGAESGTDLANQYHFRNLYPQYCGDLPEPLAQALPSLTADSFPGILVNVIAGRIANRLDLGGVNYAVDAACASALTAIELAVKELRSGSSDMVLAGGADFHNGVSDFLMFSAVGALSPSGRCRAFDERADGICLGEGVGVVVLKRLVDAERDGDRIYAVIDGIAGSSDGKALGLTAPHKEGQKRALERAYWQGGVLPAEIGLVEAHGTGTVVGDRTELKTLTEVFNAGGAVPGQAGLGSVKSQIGHTKCAAGIAGLIKVAKALHHRVLPPTQQIEVPNAAYRHGASPFRLHTKPLPWIGSGTPRAAVSAFGFGGTNFHALLSAYPAHRNGTGVPEFPVELFAVRGENLDAAKSILRSLADFLAASDAPLALRDLARTVGEMGSGPVQLAFIAADIRSLAQQVNSALAQRRDTAIHYRSAASAGGKLACLFSGQGSQYPGMLRELFVYFPDLQDVLAVAPEYVPALYPATAFDDDARRAQRQRLMDTRNAQPALGLVELAAFRWLSALGLRPDMAGGHSFGELAALATAGAFDAKALIELSRARAEAMLTAAGVERGAMAAVRLYGDTLNPLLAGFPNVVVANQNGPEQTVISGPVADVEAVCRALQRQGHDVTRIDTDCAFHSPLMVTAEAHFAAAMATLDIGGLQWPVYSNLSAAPYTDDAPSIRRGLARHIVNPVRFADEVRRMHADGARVFVEIGPRRVLTGLVRRILKDVPHTAIAIDGEEHGLAGLLEAVAQLAVLLPDFDATSLYTGRAQRLDLGKPEKLAPTTWLVNGGHARPLKGDAPAHGAAVVTAPVLAPSASSVRSATDQAFLAYLSNLRELVHAQRDALISYLGAPATGNPSSATTLVSAEPQSPACPASVAEAIAAPADIGTVLLDIVSQCTGYPPEHLDPDLDLEADLSIDSIKRLEIIGQLATRLGIAPGSREKDTLLEELAPLKNLRAMIGRLQSRSNAAPVIATPSPTAATAAADHEAAALARYVLRRRDAPPLAGSGISPAGKEFLITDDGLGLAPRVAGLLEAQGAAVRIIDFRDVPADADIADAVDGFIHLWSLNPASRVCDIKRFFAVVRESLLKKMRYLLVASGLGGDFGVAGAESNFSRGGGLAGFVKSLVKEFPDLRAHWVDLDLSEPQDMLARYIKQELLADNTLSEVAYQQGRRFAREAVPVELTEGSLDRLPLDPHSVVLLTGGARGITALIAIALARRYRCHLEIVGRSPLPDESEEAMTRGIDDPRRLRQALLAADPARKPAEVERLVRHVIAERDIRNTLAQVRAAGASVNYTRIDVCQSEAFSAFIADLYARRGRIDGVIHGAGVIEDKLVRDKTEESFSRVFDTKVSSALVLDKLIRDDVKFVVFFSSVASTFGNKGQVDYAAANDVLDKLAHSWQARISGRVLSVNWGPWADAGMVSEPLKREYQRRGIGLIPREQGVDALLRELAAGRGDAQVVLMCGSPESFGADAGRA
jgi:acyl transferase domain-containing protein/NAD(P)H-dependent flavin oxidoreductase YrpB (nitropropane dioxygenase family)/NAD(P)-dependent dehydrogenase (short-subunit alcohol dehydrogenase family)